MTKLFIDFETRSAVDIKQVGAWKYAMDPSTEVLCMAFALEESEYGAGLKDGKFLAAHPEYFGMMLGPGVVLTCHNAHFEYAIYHCILHKRYGWPALWDPKHWACTMVRAAAANLPLSLEKCGAALGIEKEKDTGGRSVMLKLCKPQGFDPLGSPIYNNDPSLFQRLYSYCKRDVEAEMELDKRLPELSPEERKIWELDLIINRRGVAADVEAARKAQVLASTFTDKLNSQLNKLTNGAVDKASRVGALKTYLKANGVEVESLDKNSVSSLMADPSVPSTVKEVIKIRQQVGKSSTAKYSAIVDVAASHDNRLRGLLQYHAAGTGRWGGRLVQPQNFPKGLGFNSDEVVDDILKTDGRPSLFHTKYGDKSMDALSAGLRGVLTAGPGKVLVSADYASIEARVLLWLADDPFALAKYKMGVNLYVDMARFIYQNDIIGKDTHKKEYAVGKAAVLGCGYGMGKDKFYATCQAWGIDVPLETAEAAVRAYRQKYRKVVDLWYSTEKAARSAVRNPGTTYFGCEWTDPETSKKGARVSYVLDERREFLVCTLPSGRAIRYFRPSLRTINTPFGAKEEIHFWAAGIGGKGLEECKTYGGSLVENIVQGTARDIMANGMLRAEEAGFPVVLTVHDELVTEKKAEEGDVEKLMAAMCALPPWAKGCPIEAEGWMGKRYRK